MEPSISRLHTINLERWQKPLAVGILVPILLAQALYFYMLYTNRSDWSITFYPAAHELFTSGLYSLKSYGFFYPAWALFPIYPFSLLPDRVGGALVGMVSMAVLGYVAYRRGAKPLELAFFLLLPQAQFIGRNGDYVDALTAIGFILPPQIGLFFVLIKPQTGAAVALFWLIQAWQRGRLREVVRIFAPVAIAYGLLLVAYHPSLPYALSQASNWVGIGQGKDVSIWPYGIVLGLALLFFAIRSADIGPAILASVCFAPYVGSYSWTVALLGLLPRRREFAAGVLAFWVIAVLTNYA